MNGQSIEAISILERALRLDDGDSASLYTLGLAYENMENYEKAINIFERLASFRPVNKDVYYHLGLSYGRIQSLAIAHYNFGRYFKELGQIKKAKFHFQKAEGLPHSSPSLKERIRKAMEEMTPSK